MEPSSSSASFTSLNNPTLSPDLPPPQSGYNQQYNSFLPPYFTPNNPPPPSYATNQQAHYAHNFNPFGAPAGYQHFRPGSSSYHCFPYQGGVGQYQQGPSGVAMASDPSSPVGSTFFFGGVGGSGSRGDESASPLSIPQPVQGSPVIEEECDSSPEEGKKNSGRKYWSEEENIRLVSAWLNNSNDPVKGNEKKYDHYWKEVTGEYNKYSPKDRKRTVPQCKSHWNKNAPKVTKFNSCWHRMKSAHGSGESDEQILERAHAVYKSENKQKPFLFEYWWRIIRDQPKWARVYPLENKRLKLNASGAYTSSSNQDTDEAIFGETYLRRPNKDDIQRLLHVGVARGFPGMLGSLDCMHWQWQNCPVAWKGQYTRGDYKVSTVMLEAVASYDLWIWHAFFGTPGSNNDINVLNNSNLFTEVLQGRAPEVQFMVNGNEYNMGYYLTDGIYPEWATFVKTVPRPLSAKDKLFAQKQEGARKDVECAFGILQARFAILRNPARWWHTETLSKIMYACIILHNMIVEDERDSYGARKDFDYDQENTAPMIQHQQGSINEFARMLEINTAIHDQPTHRRLKTDLTEHIWQRYGNNYMEQDSGSNEN